jgi:hypothetical protein
MKKSPDKILRPAPTSLAVRFKKEWIALCKLKELTNVEPDALERAIRPIVEKYGPKIFNRHNIRRAFDDSTIALDAVRRISKVLRQLGPYNRKVLSGIIKIAYLSEFSNDEISPASITPMLGEMELQLVVIRSALAFGVGAKRSQGAEPTLLHKLATLELLDKWLELVPGERRIRLPRMKNGYNAHASTEFVIQCLKMIHPAISASRARTAIQRAIEFQPEWKRRKAAAAKYELDPERMLSTRLHKQLALNKHAAPGKARAGAKLPPIKK